VAANLEPPEAVIDMPIARNPRSPKTFHASSLGKPAQTHYKVIKTAGRHCLVELKPVTGRTHQLRVHLAHIKRPIVGDTFYMGETADRLYLHAESLEITLPNGQRQTFTAPLPDSFNNWLDQHAE
jgi:23S rRNA-/tRNA-specific pseudouridylate synthase